MGKSPRHPRDFQLSAGSWVYPELAKSSGPNRIIYIQVRSYSKSARCIIPHGNIAIGAMSSSQVLATARFSSLAENRPRIKYSQDKDLRRWIVPFGCWDYPAEGASREEVRFVVRSGWQDCRPLRAHACHQTAIGTDVPCIAFGARAAQGSRLAQCSHDGDMAKHVWLLAPTCEASVLINSGMWENGQ